MARQREVGGWLLLCLVLWRPLMDTVLLTLLGEQEGPLLFFKNLIAWGLKNMAPDKVKGQLVALGRPMDSI